MDMCSPPLQLDSGSDGALTEEKLERAFREIEEASERRALEEEMSSDPGPLDPFIPPLPNVELTKKRRRQSISISRVGSYPDVPAELHRSASGVASPVVGWVPPPFCRANSRTASTSSLTSTVSSFTSSNARHHEEENHTTQKETIAGRRNTLTKAMSSAFSKTLTRIRSRGALNELGPGDEAFVIGVAVHESTTEVEEMVEVADETAGAGAGTAEASTEAMTAKGGEAQRNGGTSRPEVGQTFDSGPSRRMSITVSAPQKEEQSRSRSGSINRLRGKLPLRGGQQTPQSEGKQQQAAEDGPAMSSVEMSLSSREGAKSPPPPVNGNGKQGKRLSFFAKALAARLRRKKSEEAKEVKEREQKEKEKDKRGKHKSKISETDKNELKIELEKEKVKQKFVPPTPIYTPSPSTLLDPAILRVKSSTLSRPPPTTPGTIISEAAIPLPPSPQRPISATEVPLPPSPLPPAGPQHGAGTPPPPPEPAMIPLPASPSSLAFDIPTVNVPDEGTRADSALRETRAGDPLKELADSENAVRVVGGERLPLSALPDADFGPMSEGDGEGDGDGDGEGGGVLPTAGAPTPGGAEES